MSMSTPNRATDGALPTSAGLSEDLPPYVQEFVRKPGEWVEAASGKTFETLNPPTPRLPLPCLPGPPSRPSSRWPEAER